MELESENVTQGRPIRGILGEQRHKNVLLVGSTFKHIENYIENSIGIQVETANERLYVLQNRIV